MLDTILEHLPSIVDGGLSLVTIILVLWTKKSSGTKTESATKKQKDAENALKKIEAMQERIKKLQEENNLKGESNDQETGNQ